MITIRKAKERGHFNHGWLDTYHTFSFADYHDEQHTHFQSLRVINEDVVAPDQGFGTHGHRDMEIITYILEGALQHKDSLGTGSVIRPGEVQRMTAGRGVQHSEFNASKTDSVRLLQIWIFPEAKSLPPSYEQKEFKDAEKRDKLRLVASRDAREGSVTIHQDVDLYASVLTEGKTLEFSLRPERHAWLQVARGSIELNGKALKVGDGAAVSEEKALRIRGIEDAEFLLFDLN